MFGSSVSASAAVLFMSAGSGAGSIRVRISRSASRVARPLRGTTLVSDQNGARPLLVDAILYEILDFGDSPTAAIPLPIKRYRP